MCTLLELIGSRRTVRRLRPSPLPEHMVAILLDAALSAPSAHNCQPWRYVVLRSDDTRRELIEAMSARFRADLQADGLPQGEIEERLQASIRRLTEAPLLILACLTLADMDRYPDGGRQGAERTMGIQSVAASIQNMLLAAHALGLGAGWMCAPLFCPDVVRQALDLPPDWEPQGLVTVGWPGDHPTEPPRRPRDSMILDR